MKGSDVKDILRRKGYVLKDIAEKMGETPQNIRSILNASDMKIGKLERIAKAINKDIFFFFNEYYKTEFVSLLQLMQNLPDNESILLQIIEDNKLNEKALNRENNILQRDIVKLKQDIAKLKQDKIQLIAEITRLRNLLGIKDEAAEGEDPYGADEK